MEIGLDLNLQPEHFKPAVLSALLTAGALVGLFAYLNRYTRKTYFTIWTGAWLFYAIWLLLNLVWPQTAVSPLVEACRQIAVGMAAVLLLWGSIEFLEQRTSQRMIGMFAVFVLVWSIFGTFHGDDPLVTELPVFGLLGLANIVAAGSFFRFRQRYRYVGAGLLGFGFLLWGLVFIALPKLLHDPQFVSGCFVILALLQLFVAVSMIVLVLEEVRSDVLAAQQTIASRQDETKTLRSKVRSTEERYRVLFDQAHDAIVVLSRKKLKILALNLAAKRLLAVDDSAPEELSLLTFLPGIAPAQELTEVTDWLAHLSQTPRQSVIRRDGATCAVELQASSIDLGDRPAIQCVIREITEEVRLHEQLRQAEKLSALGQMISGVAHELNNPLTAVQGYMELILAEHEIPSKTRTALEKVAAESNRAARLVSQFLAFARADQPRREPANLNDLIRDMLTLQEYEMRIAGVTLKLELDESLPSISVDRSQVQQCLLNLVINAVHAMADKPAPRVLTIRTAPRESEIEIALSDTGPGIPAEVAPRIFEPFFTTKEVGCGTGLGLSVVHSIMTDHKGHIDYQPSASGGACFTLAFPMSGRSDIPQPASTGPAPFTKGMFEGIRVLILDDEPAIADLLGEMLNMLGCQTTIAHAGAVALTHLTRADYDVILSDYRMPQMNGEQFYREVAALKPHLAKRFIFLTGDVVNEQTHAFLTSTGNIHLAKPFSLGNVKEAIHTLLTDGACQKPLATSP